jgi:gas vesicle protein
MPKRCSVLMTLLTSALVAGCASSGSAPADATAELSPSPDAQTVVQKLRAELFKGITLSEDQQTAVGTILGEYQNRLEAWTEEHQERITKLRTRTQQVRQSRNRRQLRALMIDMRDLMQTYPDPRPYYDRIRSELTDEQKEQFDENLARLKEQMRERMRQRRSGSASPSTP